jgi:hypothetical protein
MQNPAQSSGNGLEAQGKARQTREMTRNMASSQKWQFKPRNTPNTRKLNGLRN